MNFSKFFISILKFLEKFGRNPDAFKIRNVGQKLERGDEIL